MSKSLAEMLPEKQSKMWMFCWHSCKNVVSKSFFESLFPHKAYGDVEKDLPDL